MDALSLLAGNSRSLRGKGRGRQRPMRNARCNHVLEPFEPRLMLTLAASLASPLGAISHVALNTRGYIDVTFSAFNGSTLNTSSINGDELSYPGITFSTPTLINQLNNTYRYAFTGAFPTGSIMMTVPAATFFDTTGSANTVTTLSFQSNPDTITWTGADSSDWTDPNNWDLHAVPSGDYAVINSGGIVNAASDITVAGLTNAGALTISGGGSVTIQSGGTLLNAGTIHWTGGATVLLNTGAAFTNQLGAVFDDEGTHTFSSGGGGLAGPVTNLGIYLKEAGTTTLANLNITNSGTLQIDAGALSAPTSTLTNYGVSTGAGTFILPPVVGGTGTWAGVYSIQGQVGGTFVLSGTLNWNSATIAGGSFTFAPGSVVNLVSPGAMTITNSLVNNYGTINWTGQGAIDLITATFNNLTGGVFIDNASFAHIIVASSSSFNNAGLYWKAGSGLTTFTSFVLSNSGTLQVDAGTLSLFAGLINNGTSTGAGTVLIGGSITGAGALAGNYLVEVNLTGTFNLTGTMNWNLGTLTASPVMTVSSGGVLNITTASSVNFGGGILNNAGIINWSAFGGISFNGSPAQINNLPGASFIDNGTFPSTRTMSAGSSTVFDNYGTFQKTGATITNLQFLNFSNNGMIQVDSGTLSMNGGQLTNNGTASGNGLVILPGTVTGTGVLAGKYLMQNSLTGAFTLTGSLNWVGGTLFVSPTVTFAAGSVVNVTSAAVQGGILNNAGTINWTGQGQFTFSATSSPSVFNNLPGGVFNDSSNGFGSRSIFTNGAYVINNAGTFRKSAGGTTVAQLSTLNNTGTIEVDAGMLSLTPSITSFVNDGTCSGAGTLVLPNVISGTGALAGNTTLATTLTGAFTVSGTLNWSSGTIVPSSAITIAPGGVMNITGPGAIQGGTINNFGTINWTASQSLNFSNGSNGSGVTFNNLQGGVFNDSPIGLVTRSITGSVNSTFYNAGTYYKAPGTALTTLSLPFTNVGTVTVAGGTLGMGPSFINAGTLNNAGTLFMPSFIGGAGPLTGLCVMQNPVSGNFILNGTLNWLSGSLTASPSVTFAGGSVVNMLTTPSTTITGNVTVASGAVMNIGTPSPLTIGGSLTDAGTINWTGTGGLTLSQSTFTILAGGVFNDAPAVPGNRTLGGNVSNNAIINFGTYQKSTPLSTTVLQNMAFSNYGTLAVDAGTFVPAVTSFLNDGMCSGAGSMTLPGTITGSGVLAGNYLMQNTVTGTFNLAGTLNWLSGNLAPSPAVAFLPGSLVSSGTNNAASIIGGIVNNAGTFNWTSNLPLELNANGGGLFPLINNLATGVFEYGPANSSLFTLGATNAATINNAGKFWKTAGSGALEIRATFINSGTIQCDAGSLILDYPQSSGSTAYIANGFISSDSLVLDTGVLAGSATGELALAGNISGATTNPAAFQAPGTIAFNALNPHTIEVMSPDLGGTPATSPITFLYHTLALSGTTTLVDNYRNSSPQAPEALYVDNLVLPQGATLNLNGLHVYARQTEINGSVLNGVIQTLPPIVVSRQLFYNNSSYDLSGGRDNAIAPDKTALLPGQAASFANYSSYSLGINGIIVDLLGANGTLSASDFTFKVGNDSTPSDWVPAPAPFSIVNSSRAGIYQATRIEISWADNAIENQWLQVTVKGGPGSTSGLPADDVFYFGNAIGETGNSPTDAYVNAIDELGARFQAAKLTGLPAAQALANVYDFNRDGVVDAGDEAIAGSHYSNFLNALQLIDPPLQPAAAAQTPAVAPPPPAGPLAPTHRRASFAARMPAHHPDRTKAPDRAIKDLIHPILGINWPLHRH